jgi:hypothetical protein
MLDAVKIGDWMAFQPDLGEVFMIPLAYRPTLVDVTFASVLKRNVADFISLLKLEVIK